MIQCYNILILFACDSTGSKTRVVVRSFGIKASSFLSRCCKCDDGKRYENKEVVEELHGENGESSDLKVKKWSPIYKDFGQRE